MSATISERGAKIAASRIGVTVGELLRRRAAGEKWCPRCEHWRPDIGQPYCRACVRAYQREMCIHSRIRHIKGARS